MATLSCPSLLRIRMPNYLSHSPSYHKNDCALKQFFHRKSVSRLHTTIRIRCSTHEVTTDIHETRFPLEILRSLVVLDVGKRYTGPLESKYWRLNLKTKLPMHPYTVGYKAKKTYKKQVIEQSTREGPLGPEFVIVFGTQEFCGESPEAVWQAAGVVLGMSEAHSKKDAKALFGFDSEEVRNLLMLLKPIHSEGSGEVNLENTGDNILELEEEEEEFEEDENLEELDGEIKSFELQHNEDDKSLEHTLNSTENSTKLEEKSKEESNNAENLFPLLSDSSSFLKGKKDSERLESYSNSQKVLLRLRTAQVEGSGFQLPFPWSLYDRFLETPVYVEKRSPLGNEIIPSEEAVDSTPLFKSEPETSAKEAKAEENTPKGNGTDLIVEEELGDEIQEETTINEDKNGDEFSEAELKPSTEEESEEETPRGQARDFEREQKGKSGSSKKVDAEVKKSPSESLVGAPPLTPVAYYVGKKRHRAFNGLLFAAVAGSTGPLYAVLGVDNIFRLIPEEEVHRAYTEKAMEVAIVGELQKELKSMKIPSVAGLMPGKEKWKAAFGGKSFLAEGSPKSKELLVSFLKATNKLLT